MVDSEKAFMILYKYYTKQELDDECKRCNIQSRPLDLVGRNNLYCDLLYKKMIEFKKIKETNEIKEIEEAIARFKLDAREDEINR